MAPGLGLGLGLSLTHRPPQSGGGGGPDYLFTANFADAEYVLAGESVAYDDLFVVDSDNWGSGTVITPGTGITTNGDAIASTPTAALLENGGTLVIGVNVQVVDTADGFEVQIFNAPTYDKFVSVLVNAQASGSRIADETNSTDQLSRFATTGAHKVAIAFEPGRIAASVDSGSVVTMAYSHFATFTELAMTVLGTAAITSCDAIASAVSDEMLQALSAPP